MENAAMSRLQKHVRFNRILKFRNFYENRKRKNQTKYYKEIKHQFINCLYQVAERKL